MTQTSANDNPKTVLITGASRGIGRGIALSLARDGMRIIVNYARNAQAAEDTVADIIARGGEAFAVQADIADADDRARLIHTTLDRYGTLDVLVNNAGVAPASRADILDASEESFDRLIAINLKGPYFLTQAVAKVMISLINDGKQDGGTITTISSISAYTASVNRGDYCVSKAGLSMMTALFAARLAQENIRVYEIRPGVIETDMTGAVKEKYDALIAGGLTPIRRWGRPDDIGKAVRAIIDGVFPFSTGEVINVDGGFHLRTL